MGSSRRMAPLLGREKARPHSTSKSRRTFPKIEAILGIITIGWAFWHLVHWLQDHVAANFALSGIYPFLGVATIVASLPFFMYLSFSEEFGSLHPLRPADYWFLCGRLAQSARNNNLKLSSKDL